MLKKKLFLVLVALLSSYSYSEGITPYYGQTGNAAANGYSWGMNSVLPSGIPGLDINAIIYNYTPIKKPEDAMKVHIQNENALGTGYIFRETDDWTGATGGIEIRKVVPVVPNIPRAAWGQGSIEVEGTGTVTDANVIYSYKVDPCYDPQFNPNCPGYKTVVPDITQVDLNDLYDVNKDGNVTLDRNVDKDLLEMSDEEKLSEKELAENEAAEKEKSKERLEKALAEADNSRLFAEAFTIAKMIDTMNLVVNMNSYYGASIPGGTYKDSVTLNDKKLPENKNGLRNGLAQQILHQKMIEMQY